MRRSILAALVAALLIVAPVIAANGLTLNGTPQYGATVSYSFNDGGGRFVMHRCFVAEGQIEIGGKLYWQNPDLVQGLFLAPDEPIVLDDWAATEQYAFCDAEVFRLDHNGYTVSGQFYFQYPVPPAP